jgi:hypothetical protein
MVLASFAECSYLTKQLMFHVEHQLEARCLVNFTSKLQAALAHVTPSEPVAELQRKKAEPAPAKADRGKIF